MNHFKFHPVGQGLFYTGSLDDGNNRFNFVYDCGTKSKGKYLSKAIDSYIESIRTNALSNPPIDFVVISHLHTDHYSGLYELAKKSKISKVYLPYWGDTNLGYNNPKDCSNLISLVLANDIFSNMVNFDTDINLFTFMCKLYKIRMRETEGNAPYSELQPCFLNNESILDKKDTDIFNDYGLSPVHIKHIETGNRDWKFTLLSRSISKEKLTTLNQKLNKVLSKAFKKELETELSEINLANWILGIKYLDEEEIKPKDRIQRIRELYDKVFEDELKNDPQFFHQISTVLIHYPVNQPALKYSPCEPNFPIRMSNHALPSNIPYTLLSGDISMDEKMSEAIRSELSPLNFQNPNYEIKITVFQIPHHGSKENWKKWEKANICSAIYVVPFGWGNIHKHPSSDTMEALNSDKKTIYLVNQTHWLEYSIG